MFRYNNKDYEFLVVRYGSEGATFGLARKVFSNLTLPSNLSLDGKPDLNAFPFYFTLKDEIQYLDPSAIAISIRGLDLDSVSELLRVSGIKCDIEKYLFDLGVKLDYTFLGRNYLIDNSSSCT